MTGGRYPLAAALRLRQAQLDSAMERLRQSQEALRIAAESLRAAEDELSLYVSETAKERGRIGTRQGQHSAAELEHAHRYLERRRCETLRLREERQSCQERVEHAALDEEAARSRVMQARALQQTVERHEARWKRAQTAAAHSRLDEEATDGLQRNRE